MGALGSNQKPKEQIMYIETPEIEITTVFLDQITHTGSAFAARTDNGEVVFINSRIVSAVKLREGDTLRATIIPNYEDKRHSVQWRAIRVTVLGDPIKPAAPTPEETEQVAQDNMVGKLYVLLDTYGPLRTATLSRMMGLATIEVGVLCRDMYAAGNISMAEVYSSPENSRPSHKVWAVSINDFDVDPFDADVE